MFMISQEALDARNRASASSVPFPGPVPDGTNPFLGQMLPGRGGYGSEPEYESNEIVLTIRHLLANSPGSKWGGTLNEILAAGRAQNWLVNATLLKLSWQIWALEGLMRLFDNIYHYEWREDGQLKHFFCIYKVDDDSPSLEALRSCNFTLDSCDISEEELSAYVDGINKTYYEETDAFARCPGFLVNHMLGHPKCPNMTGYCRCALLDHQRANFFGKSDKGTVELVFGVRIDLPSKYYEEVILDFSASEKLTMLKLYDRVCAAKIHYEHYINSPDAAAAYDALNNAQHDFDLVLEYFHQIGENNVYAFKRPCCTDGKHQPHLNRFYAEDQFVERSLRGEPVLFHQGRLYFESFIFEHGYQPGIFPGLDLYTKDGKPVDPEEFSQWLKQMLPERTKNFHRRASFWGCPACVVTPGDLVRYVDIQSTGRVVLGNSYRLSPISSNVFRSPGFDKDCVTYFPDQRVNYL